jgi:hypothetical protein
MAQPYISSALSIAFHDQSAKIQEIYSLGNGWEGWAQVEIALGFKNRFAYHEQSLALQNIAVYSEREKGSYEGSDKRCDFLVTYVDKTNNKSAVLFYELKCMRRNLSLAQFAGEVGKDIEKVKNGNPLEEWMLHADQVAGWVIAITVHTGNPDDHSIAAAMEKIAAEKSIQWWTTYSTSITPDNVVRVWLWTKHFK